MEFEYDYTIINADGQYECGYGRRGFVNAHSLGDEFLDPAIDIPVHPQRNWVLIQINIRHLQRNRDYWFIQPSGKCPTTKIYLRKCVFLGLTGKVLKWE